MTSALIVDDHTLFAEAIGATLQSEGFDIVGIVGTGDDAVEAARDARPDLVLMDLGLPDRSGIEVGKAILDERPSTKILAVAGFDDPASVGEAVRAGFHGYVSKDAGIAHLLESLNAVSQGRIVIPRTAGRRMIEGDPGRQQAHRLAASLTAREREILGLLVQGVPTRGIAGRLHISPNTVRSHVQALLTKLQVHSRLEAVAFATRNGLVPG
jgi:two-component system, NarL family, nitrate/nitrite response regulator NarL